MMIAFMVPGLDATQKELKASRVSEAVRAFREYLVRCNSERIERGRRQ